MTVERKPEDRLWVELGPWVMHKGQVKAAGFARPTAEDMRAAGWVPASASLAVIQAMRDVMALGHRDWGFHESEAWLYGIVVGWGDALPAVAERHGWTPTTCARLVALRASVAVTHLRVEAPADG